MNSQLEANRKKYEEMKKRRMERQTGSTTTQVLQTTSTISQPRPKRQYSLQKSDHVHIPGSLIETYDMQVQCALETRSLDSKPTKQQQNQEIDLLVPRQHKHRRRDQHKKDEAHKQIPQLSQEELSTVVKSRNFSDFFNRSSKFLQKVLDHGNGDMIEMLLTQGMKNKDRSRHAALTPTLVFQDPNYTNNRVVTDLDWSPQINQLFLASYSQNQEGSIKDHVGLALVWNPILKNRPQFYCFCQSAITSITFFPYSNSTIMGGCYNGQILLWDMRVKSMPVQRSGISADAHKYPVYGLEVVGTQIAHNLVSFSNDGMMCLWDTKQLSKPARKDKLTATRVAKAPRIIASSIAGLPSRATRADLSSVSNSILQKQRDETHDINIMCAEFPTGDLNNYYLGSLNGVLYRNALHNKQNQKIQLYDEHNGPVSGLSINNPSEFDALNGLVLTSSFDWTVKLWNSQNPNSLRTFQNSEDYIYDVKWNPTNPSVFATVNNDGYLDLFDLTRDMQMPIAHEKASKHAINKLTWNNDGSSVICGDSSGAISMHILAEKYRRMQGNRYDDLVRNLAQKPEVD